MKIPLISFLLFSILLNGIRLNSQTFTMPAGSGVSSSASTCAGTFVDNGGAAGNYSNNQNSRYEFCPSVAGQYVSVTFTSYNTEAGFDYLLIYDGNSTSGSIIASLNGNLGAGAGTYTSSTSNGCLTFRFSSDNITRFSGWSATISCSATPGAGPSSGGTDCNGGTTICNNSTFSGNSSGFGNMDLASGFDGCLNYEHQSSWYYFSPSSAGTVGFTISPNNGTDDYDFALWGPQANNACPGLTGNAPLRCSYAAGGGNTGCGNGAVDNTEGALGDRWVSTFNVNAGEIYILVIDNFSATASPFTLTWTLTGGASLDCTVLPIELISWTGSATETCNMLDWTTASETNNDYFTIERAGDDGSFSAIGIVDGQGTSSSSHSYRFLDNDVSYGTSYYRLRQTDFNGMYTVSRIIPVARTIDNILVSDLHPNPTNGELHFNFTGPEATSLQLRILDPAGLLIHESILDVSEGSNQLTATINGLGAGIYLLDITDLKTGVNAVKRVVKY